MKKLMIAAAAAAMIGGVEAYEPTYGYVYDFKATLTTTTGTEGRSTAKTYTVNLGKYTDEVGTHWWYDDGIFPTSSDGKFRDAVIGGVTYEKVLKAGNRMYPWKLNTSVVKTDEFKELLAAALGFDGEETRYNEQQEYRGAPRWCETFKYKYTFPGDCYRVKGTKKIVATIYADEACDDATIVESNDDVYDFTVQFLNFFGAQLVEKATKVEALFTFDTDDTGYGNLDNADGENLGFALAGQGTWKDKLFVYNKYTYAGIDSISGNIVGYLPAPDCEACCADPAAALAFECAEEVGQRTPSYSLPTAAYGTWSMKFNRARTLELNDGEL